MDCGDKNILFCFQNILHLICKLNEVFFITSEVSKLLHFVFPLFLSYKIPVSYTDYFQITIDRLKTVRFILIPANSLILLSSVNNVPRRTCTFREVLNLKIFYN